MWIWGDTVQPLTASDSWRRWDVAKDTTRRPAAPVILRQRRWWGPAGGALLLPPPWPLAPEPQALLHVHARRRWLGLCAASGRRSVPARSSAQWLVLPADSSEMSAWVAARFAKGFPSLQGPVRAGAQLPRRCPLAQRVVVWGPAGGAVSTRQDAAEGVAGRGSVPTTLGPGLLA